MVMSLSRVLWKVRSKAPTVTASVQGTVSVTGEGYTTIRDSTCGAGNFLNLAYAKLREIETDLLADQRRRTGSQDLSLDVSLDQRIHMGVSDGLCKPYREER